MTELNEFLKFLKHPKSTTTKTNPYSMFFKILLIDLVFITIYFLMIYLLEKLNMLDQSLLKNNVNYSEIAIILITLIAGPIAEEYIFRYLLAYKKFNPFNIFIYGKLHKIKLEENIENEAKQELYYGTWNLIFPRIYYLSVICFAFWHINNYNISINNLIYIPLLLLPPFVVGLFAGYLRVKINMFSAILLHISHNSFVLAIMLLSMGNQTVKTNEISNNYFGNVSVNYNEVYFLSIQEILDASNSQFKIEDENKSCYYFVAQNIEISQLSEYFNNFYKDKRNADLEKMKQIKTKVKYNISFVKRSVNDYKWRDTLVKKISEFVCFGKY